MSAAENIRHPRALFTTRRPGVLALAFALWLTYFGLLKGIKLIITYSEHGRFTGELDGSLSLLNVALGHFFSLGVAWLAVTRWHKRPFLTTVGIDWGEFRDWAIKKGAKFGPLALGLSVAAGLALHKLTRGLASILPRPAGHTHSALELGGTPETYIIYAILATLTGPVVEEIFYRGILFTRLERSIGLFGGAFLVSVLFAVHHMWQYSTVEGEVAWTAMFLIWMHGMVLAYTRRLTRSLIPGIVIHATFNGLNVIRLWQAGG